MKIYRNQKRAVKFAMILIAFAAIFACFSGFASAATLQVGPGQTYSNISSAVSAAGANDVINVHSNPGGYTENVIVSKSNLTIQANTGDSVTVQTTGNNKVFSINNANYVNIRGFNLQSDNIAGSYGLSLTNAGNCNIMNNNLNTFRFGVYSTGSNNKISNNSFYNVMTAVSMAYPSHNNIISSNTVSNPSYDPVAQTRVGFREDAQYTGGWIPNQNNKYLNNQISNVNEGIFIQQGSNFTISGNHISIRDTYGYAWAVTLSVGNTANQLNTVSNNFLTSEGKVNFGSRGLYLISDPSSPLNANIQIIGNSFTNFDYGIYGILYKPTGTPVTEIYFNRFYNNTRSLAMSGSTATMVINAVNNWWSKNSGLVVSNGPSQPASYDIWWNAGTVTYNPWLVLNAKAPATVSPGSNVIIVGDLQHNSNGVYYNPVNGHIPDGIPVSFAGDAYGSVSPLSGTTANGITTTTFTAGSVTGVSHPTVTIDGVTVPVSINIADVIPTSLVVNPITGYPGDLVDLTAILTDTSNNIPVSGKTVEFIVNGIPIGSAVTNASGVATLPYTIALNAGNIYQILAQFAGDLVYSGASGTGNLTVNHIPTNLAVIPITGYPGDLVNLTATLTDTAHNTPVSGKTVEFIVNGTPIGSALTNASGIATLPYTIALNAGNIYQILAQFAGDLVYSGASGTGNLTVNHIPTNLAVTPVTGYPGDLVNLTATLTDTAHSTPVSGKTVEFIVNGTPIGSALTNASGIATLPYTIALNAGNIYQILAQFAGDTLYAANSNTGTLTVNHIPTNLAVIPITGYPGDLVNLTATLTDTAHNTPVSGKTVEFIVNGTPIGSALTNASGIATLPYTIALNAGNIYQILAQFAGDTLYAANSNTGTLTVNHIPTNLAVTPVTGYYNDLVNLTATLTDTYNNVPVSGQTISFTVNGSPAGTALTDVNGKATLLYMVTQGAGVYQILAEFLATNIYSGSSGNNSLTINYIPTSISVGPLTSYYGDQVDLTAQLTDNHNNIPISGKMVDFTVNGSYIGSVLTDVTGLASMSYTIPLTVGTYQILAQFAGDNAYSGSNNLANLMVNHIPTILVINPVSGYPGDTIIITAILTNLHNNVALNIQTINFWVDYNLVGSALTDSSGTATFTYTIPLSGITLVMGQFLGDNIYSGSTGTTKASTNLFPTQIVTDTVSGFKGNLVNLTATLTDTHNHASISGAIVNFSVNGAPVGSALTNANGLASLPYTITLNPGIYEILSWFNGNAVYAASNSKNNLSVGDNTPPTVIASPLGGTYNTSKIVTLTTTDPDSTAITYYTTNGSDPKNPASARSIYSSPINITSTTTLRFCAVDPAGNWSPNYTQTYTIDKVAPTASANPKGGLYNTNKSVTLTMSEKGNIYYTTNGTTPTSASTKYTAPISITSTKTLKYIAIDLAGNKSPVYTQIYTIDKVPPKVASTTPKNNAIGFSLTAPIYINFSENIIASINWSKVTMKNLSTGKAVSFTKTISGKTLTIKMTSSRLRSNLYQIYIPASAVKDKAGNNLATGYTLRFRT